MRRKSFYQVKLSYSCMLNIKNNEAHNEKVTSPQQTVRDDKRCNCHKTVECRLENKCLTKGITYQAMVTSENCNETYICMAEPNLNPYL